MSSIKSELAMDGLSLVN